MTVPESAKRSLAHLSPEALQKVKRLEETLGPTYVLAYDPPLQPADLTPEQLAEVKQVEQELGVCLVAYAKAA